MQSEKRIDPSLNNIRNMILMLPVCPLLQKYLLVEIDQATFHLSNRDFLRLQRSLSILGQKISVQLLENRVLKHHFVPLANELQEVQHILTGLAHPPASTVRMEPNKSEATPEPLSPVSPASIAQLEPGKPQTALESLNPIPLESIAQLEFDELQTTIKSLGPIFSDSTMTPVSIAVENVKEAEISVKEGYLKWNFPSRSSIHK